MAEQIRVLANQAMEYNPDWSQDIADKYNLPVDQPKVAEWLEDFDPNRLVNEFQCMSPQINLQNLPKQDQLEIFEAVVKFLTKSDRYNSLK